MSNKKKPQKSSAGRQALESRKGQRRKVEVYVPELEKTLEVRSLSYSEYAEVERRQAGKKQSEAGIINMIATTYDPETDERYFSYDDFDFIKDEADMAIVNRLCEGFAKLYGVADEVQDAEKN